MFPGWPELVLLFLLQGLCLDIILSSLLLYVLYFSLGSSGWLKSSCSPWVLLEIRHGHLLPHTSITPHLTPQQFFYYVVCKIMLFDIRSNFAFKLTLLPIYLLSWFRYVFSGTQNLNQPNCFSLKSASQLASWRLLPVSSVQYLRWYARPVLKRM